MTQPASASPASVGSDAPILALNSGSSSLKLGLFRAGAQGLELLASGGAEGIGRKNGSVSLRTGSGEALVRQEHILESQQDALTKLIDALQQRFPHEPAAIGHRFVHGGPQLREHQPITPAVRDTLQRAMHFAPLHIPMALDLVRQAEAAFPRALQIACFDTAFHRTLPAPACHLPIPEELFEEGVLRYGFHGLSYESIVQRLGTDLPERAVFAHLGNGSSLAAVRRGRSVDTTMGLTPTGGIPMGTRSGDLDPGVLLYLLRNKHADADSLEAMLNHESGLAALSGGESDMQQLLARAGAGDQLAQLAIDAFCLGVTKTIGAYAALLGGVELVVFTGGIGQHSTAIRKQVCAGLGFLGLSDGEDESATVRIFEAQEEQQIAEHCRRLLAQSPALHGV